MTFMKTILVCPNCKEKNEHQVKGCGVTSVRCPEISCENVFTHSSEQISALISDCGNYRYWLSRDPDWADVPDKDGVVFVMLNPSTADAAIDDPTIRRCKSFARLWGNDGLVVVNLYAYRATSPKDMLKEKDPVGPDNDYWIYRMLTDAKFIVCAWGKNANPERVEHFVRYLPKGAELKCLGINKDGSPKHPLYIKSDQPLIEWSFKS